jgi:hypothetical protein
MNSRFAKAVAYNPKSRKVLGRTLLPISIRHRVVLEFYESPFVTGKEPTVEDIIFAVRVMSNTEKDEMHKTPTEAEMGYTLILKNNEDAKYEVIDEIREHIQENSNWPIFWEKDNKTASNGIPWHMNVISSLVRNGIGYEQAWTMPEAEAIWMYASNLAHEGSDVRIVSDEDEAAMALHKAALEEMKKQQEEINKNV